MTKILLNELADVLKVHPRTVLRALSGKENTYWASDHNPSIEVVDVALAYDIELDVLQRVLKGRDHLLTSPEAAAHISFIQDKNVPLRTFRYRKYPTAIRTTGVVRYSKLAIGEYHAVHVNVRIA